MIEIKAGQIEMTLNSHNGTLEEFLTAYNVPFTGKTILINGTEVAPDTQLPECEEEDIYINVTSTDIRVIKQVGEFADITLAYHEGMTVQEALSMAMQQAGLEIETDGLTCMDYSRQPNIGYPAGLRSEKVKPGAELHLITTDKFNNGI